MHKKTENAQHASLLLLPCDLDQIRQRIASARSIAVLTGAGVSAESGIPTFRGNNGLWKTYRAEDLATPEAFARDPKLVWEWYDWRRGLIASAQPNAAHSALAALQARTLEFALITQNVDNLHERAGSRNVLHLHGSIWRMRCLACAKEMLDSRSYLPEIPPLCKCGGLLRPSVVWFGESLPQKVWRKAEAAARKAELFLVVGTSALVYPAAGLAQLAKSAGATLIEVNTAETALSRTADYFLQGSAAEVLPQLISQRGASAFACQP